MTHNKSYTLKEIATLTKSTLVGDPECKISHVADLEGATPQDISFLSNPKYEPLVKSSSAGAIVISPKVTPLPGKNFLIAEDPSLTFQSLINLFLGEAKKLTSYSGIHPSAIVHPSCKIGKNVTIAPYSVIDEEVEIGDNVEILSHVSIGRGVTIGENALIHSHVTIRERCVLGKRVVIQPGAVIGSCGFGYHPDKFGKHQKLDQLGIVILEDDVEIGANTTIDRARFKATVIARGTKIDNLVQIAHGVMIGEDNLIIAQTGIAGSTTTGKHVVLAGQVAIAGHIHLADGVMISAKSGVSKNLTKAGKYGGIPVLPLDEYNRNAVHLRNIEKLIERVKKLEAASKSS